MAQASRPRTSSRFANKNLQHNDDSRMSSQIDNEVFTTATGFSLDDVLHSTPQQQDFSMPLQYDQYAEPSEHSSDISIELGRAVKRGARQDQDIDRSSNALFNSGNDNSMYDLSPAQPSRQPPAQRHSEGLRKDATIRRATESARANDGLKRSISNPKQRAVSENYTGATTSAKEPVESHKASRGRFSVPHVSTRANLIPVGYRQPVGLEFNNGTATGNLTTQTTQTVTYTNNQSFALPNIPNIAELISGVRTEATPVKRASRSRFASASFKPQPREHLPVQRVTVPEDERVIYASLQLLRDRVNQLEAENNRAQKRNEDYEDELIELRRRLDAQVRRPDSGVGMEDGALAQENTRLQAEVKALQERLNRAERKSSVSETAMGRITKERDALVAHVGSAHSEHEQLVEENQALKASEAHLEAENEQLREEVYALRGVNNDYRQRLERVEKRTTTRSKDFTSRSERAEVTKDGPWNISANERMAENSIRSRKEGKAAPGVPEQTSRRKPSEHTDDALIREITNRIERDMQNIKEATLAEIREATRAQEQPPRFSNARSRSRSQRRQASMGEERNTTTTSKRYVSAPAEMQVSGVDSTTDIDVYRKTRPAKTAVQIAVETLEEDLTVLSELDLEAVADLRKKLEQELRDGKSSSRRKTSIHKEDATNMSTGHFSITRRSSMKEIPKMDSINNTATARTLEDINKIIKTVRVQSPHSSDAQSHPGNQSSEDIEEAGETSMLSNTSRRRRRNGPADNMTSAFIVPDITFHSNLTCTPITSKNIPHDPATCTGCTDHPTIPTPNPVTTREELQDLTSATIRPAQDPESALAEVIKKLEDEVTHLKLSRENVNRKYNAHDPAIGKRRRAELRAELERLTNLLEKRCDLVYGLYDVLEGRPKKQANAEADVEENSGAEGQEWGAEASGRKGRGNGEGLPDLESFGDDGSESEELPWEGISESGDDESLMGSEVGQRTRRSSGGF